MEPVYSIAHPQTLNLEQQRVLRNTYWLLGLSLIPTALGALLGLRIPLSVLQAHPLVYAVAVLAVFYGMIFAIERNRDSSRGVYLLLAFTLLMGVLLGPLLQVALGLKNGAQLVALAAGGTGLTFFLLAGIATAARRDFGFLGNFLMVGVVIAMIGVVANLFLASPVLHLTLCTAIMLLSAGLILWQLNAIVRGGETNYVSATLTLYVSVYNLFSTLLQLLMAFGSERE
ncbi:Bax inhibitor-1/YccA family protein [Pelomicrobium sp.]|jgi:modulator of FtsH protease|uniref:Bax inhibitor-1/YccA family protein n=1 Tax=Pelomicrobium sp. TaxID=2815319 RepID=UPI002FDEFE12